jgi:hypothetical protein
MKEKQIEVLLVKFGVSGTKINKRKGKEGKKSLRYQTKD